MRALAGLSLTAPPPISAVRQRTFLILITTFRWRLREVSVEPDSEDDMPQQPDSSDVKVNTEQDSPGAIYQYYGTKRDERDDEEEMSLLVSEAFAQIAVSHKY